MQEVNPEMVIIARESRGLSQSALSRKIGISQGILSKIETGAMRASDDILSKIENALEYPQKFFYQVGRIYPGISYHRKRKSIPQKTLDQIDANVNILRIHFEKLLKNIDFLEINIPHFSVDEEEMNAEDIARAVRQKLMLPRGPIENLTRILEDAGCIIMHCDFGTRMIDGLSLCVPKLPPMMFINKNIPADRLRFTVAHELGHIVMHKYFTPTMEDEANEFAAEFLMPSSDIRSELTGLSIEKLACLKMRWKTSMQALLYRANTLQKIAERNKQYLWMQICKAGYRVNEPIEIEFEKPTLYQEIIDTHIEDLNYSIEELCDVVCMHEDEFEKIYFNKEQNLRLLK